MSISLLKIHSPASLRSDGAHHHVGIDAHDQSESALTIRSETALSFVGLRTFHTGQEIPAGQVHFQRRYTQRFPLGCGRPHPAVARSLRLKQDRRFIVPLSSAEVAKFWQSFRTYRDLALVGLMLLDGLRSCEVLALQLEDLQLAEGQLRTLGKGNKKRLVPLPPEILEVLERYLRLERPLTNSPALFVSLKGRHRAQAMTPAGLRSLFRHHRVQSLVRQANPHRLRYVLSSNYVLCFVLLIPFLIYFPSASSFRALDMGLSLLLMLFYFRPSVSSFLQGAL